MHTDAPLRLSARIEVPLRGKATVRLPYAPNNREWLWGAVDTRRPVWNRAERHWEIPRVAAKRVFEACTTQGRPASLQRTFRHASETCMALCQQANPRTVDTCTCQCGGKYHGVGIGAIGRSDIVIVRYGAITVRTITNHDRIAGSDAGG